MQWFRTAKQRYASTGKANESRSLNDITVRPQCVAVVYDLVLFDVVVRHECSILKSVVLSFFAVSVVKDQVSVVQKFVWSNFITYRNIFFDKDVYYAGSHQHQHTCSHVNTSTGATLSALASLFSFSSFWSLFSCK